MPDMSGFTGDMGGQADAGAADTSSDDVVDGDYREV